MRRKGINMENEFILQLQQKNQISKIMNTNGTIQKFGLSITESEAAMLTREKNETLKELQRVEFGECILEKIIVTFCDSAYIDQNNLTDTIRQLQQIFYMYKNEAMDEVSDDELLEYMKEKFEGQCQGSLEYLEGTVLDEFAREIRSTTRKYMGRYIK